jgi:alpha-galactosidase
MTVRAKQTRIMTGPARYILPMLIAGGLGALAVPACEAKPKPLYVFILAGQSNMQGHANISTMDAMAEDPKTAPILRELRNPDGTPRTCKRVWISSVGCAGDGYSDVIEQTGRLTAGFGASRTEIGPEYSFGIYMERMLDAPILLIKTAWGGRNLHTDFRPPSAGPERINDYTLNEWRKRGLDVEQETAKVRQAGGLFYRHMIEHVRKVLADIKRVVPDYDPRQGYRLAGFVWFQGWNDLVDQWAYPDRMKPGGYDEYARLLTLFIRDVRRDLSAPNLPFVIGVMGVGGDAEGKKPPQCYFRQAQAAPASLPEFRGNVAAAETSQFWDDELADIQVRLERLRRQCEEAARKDPNMSPEAKEAALQKAIQASFTPHERHRMKAASHWECHYWGAAKIIAPIGKVFAEAMARLMKLRPR